MITEYLQVFSSTLQGMPRFAALARAVIGQVEDLIAVVQEMPAAFSLEQAVGVQLDILGEGFGVDRKEGQDDEAYRMRIQDKLALWRWNGTNEGVNAVLEDVSPGSMQNDRQDGSVEVMVEGSLPGMARELFPVSAGIGIRD